MLYKCLPFQLDIRRAAVRPYLPGVSSSQDADEHSGASSGRVWGGGATESSSRNLRWIVLGDFTPYSGLGGS